MNGPNLVGFQILSSGLRRLVATGDQEKPRDSIAEVSDLSAISDTLETTDREEGLAKSPLKNPLSNPDNGLDDDPSGSPPSLDVTV